MSGYWAVSVVEFEKGLLKGERGKYINQEVYIVRDESDLKAREQGKRIYRADIGYPDSILNTRVKWIGYDVVTTKHGDWE